MSSNVRATEGHVAFRGFQTWYRVVGEGEEPGKLPLLCLHGGPGFSYDYLESLEDMARTGRRVIFYDQLGAGNSDRPSDPELWTVELFLGELRTIREELDLDRVHLFGSSWGGMLAMEYALTRPAGLASLVLASSPASIPLWAEETARLRSELPEDVRQTLDENEQAETLDDPAYEKATMEFYKRHLCRTDPWPDGLNRSFAKVNPEVYGTMQGPNEFVITGTLKDWDITDRLGEIDVPTLVTSGRYDECTPRQAEIVHRGIHGSQRVLFDESSHVAFIEERDLYMQVLGDFLAGVENPQ
ncbi:MAG: proline iminopeptidase-family hydrolase [Actinobacteria bacterium]|nr:proline iminopeptidase-family hydrolase [Actinomycetota bacterium]